MQGSTADLSPEDVELLRRGPFVERIAPRNATKAEVLVCRHAGRTIALKDYGARPFLVRQLIGRYLIRRESAAYRTVGELSGLARFLGRAGPFALATEWIEARPLAALDPQQVSPACFDRLAEIVDALHRRGVAIADLHHRDVLIDDRGSVYVVDLALAWIGGTGWRRRVFEWAREQDLVAVARLRARFSGADPSEAIEGVGRAAARRHAVGRRLKRTLDLLRGRRRY